MTDNLNDFILSEDERIDDINMGLRIIQNKKGLLFGTDALMLSDFMREAKREDAAELGSGTGVISLLSARAKKFCHVTAFEVQEYYASLTSRNAALNGLSDRVDVKCADVRTLGGDMCGRYGVVFSNPPYMGAENGKKNEDDKKYIARHEVMGGISDFVGASARLLRFGGRAYFVMRPDRLIDLTSSMRNNGIEPKRMRFVSTSPEREPSIVLIEGVRGGRSGLSLEIKYIDGNAEGESKE